MRDPVRRCQTYVAFFAGICGAMALALPLCAAPKPAIRFEANAVVGERITAGGAATWFSIAHEPQPYHLRLRERATSVRDDDRDGVVRLELNANVPPDSVWVLIDMTTGEYAVAQPAEGRIRLRKLPPPAMVKKGNGASAKFAQTYEFVNYWFIRPGVGAWFRQSEDGGEGDDDGKPDGKATVNLDAFSPVGDSPRAPNDFQRGDLVLVVDPVKLALFELRLDE